MSKLELNKLNFQEEDFEVVIQNPNHSANIDKNEITINRANQQAQETIDKARLDAKKIIHEAQENSNKKSNEIIEKAQNDAKEIIEKAQKEAKEILERTEAENKTLIEQSQTEIERRGQESALKGYDEGYKDAQEKFLEEIQEKIQEFDNFCSIQSTIKDKILKNASRDMLNLISEISKAVILKEIDGEILSKIINKTIQYFEKKEDITIILSEEYAKMLYQFQKKNLDLEDNFNFNDFKQYENFQVVYNNQIAQDTIIIENNKERYDASINEQLNVIIREIYEKTRSGNIDIGEYEAD